MAASPGTVVVQRATRSAPIPPAALLRRAALAAREGACEVTVRIVGEAEGRELNARFRGRDYPTNVLSFAYATEPVLAGDLVLCATVVQREAQEQGKALEAHYVHLVVHGMLHLQGHDHEEEAQAQRMEALERTIVTGLGYPDPYPEETLP